MPDRMLRNYVGGEWVESKADETTEVRNPATTEVLAHTPFTPAAEVTEAVAVAKAAYPSWRETPAVERAQHMFALKHLMEDHFEELSRVLVQEHGKTIGESRGEIRRTIQMVEAACGIPSLMMGYNAEDVASGIDEYALLQPLGVFACLAPFNFPAMVPFWFMPFAVACGNTYIVKPAHEVPLSQERLFGLLDEAGFPPGVVNLVNGHVQVAETLMKSDDISGVSFVGSSKVARIVYRTCGAQGKRVQAQGGAKNFMLVMPDANLDAAVPNIMNSVFGCAGQRCLAGAVILAIEEVYEELKARLVEAAFGLKVGYGMDETVDVGPLTSQAKMENVERWIEKGVEEGAELILDGRGITAPGYENGYFVGPTVFDEVSREMEIANEEIFGPVMAIIRVTDFEEALDIIAANRHGNAATIYTSNGGYAREFRYRVECGNIGINVGVVAPMAFFPFAGKKDSFFGDLHGQGRDVIQFFTDRKVVVERWL